jgi:hypothetical protein
MDMTQDAKNANKIWIKMLNIRILVVNCKTNVPFFATIVYRKVNKNDT